MNIPIMGLDAKQVGQAKLPVQFDEPVRADLIKRAVLAIQSGERQPYGADPRAGRKQAAKLSRRRRDYKGSYGKGISRSPRKIMTRRGTQMNWTGAFAPNTVGGRRAFAPRSGKVWAHKINDKERRKAIRSAISATMHKDFVVGRGHKIPSVFPFAIDDSFEGLNSSSDVMSALLKLQLSDELSRSSVVRTRGGRSARRGRGRVSAVGPLFVVSKDSPLVKAARNIPGVDAVVVSRLNARLLAPGRSPARLTLFTSAAIQKMEKEKLFL